MRSQFAVPFEYKFAADGTAGEFEGYASVFGVQDSHGDLIKPGAFSATLAERKAAGRGVPMHVMHGFLGGDGLPVGVWKAVAEDDKGLAVQGKISGATTTEQGKRMHELVRDGALPGLSIGWSSRPNGTVRGEKAGEPKRTLKAVNLHEISLVTDPSNAQSVVTGIKSFADADPDSAAASIAAAIGMHDKVMKGYSYSGSAKDQALLMDHLRDAHQALTGTRAPDGLEGWTKSISREDYIAGVKSTFGLSDKEAAAMADLVLKVPAGAAPDVKAADFSFLSNFTLPSI